MNRVRVLLVDDHPLFRRGVRWALESHPTIEVVGEAGDGEQAVARIGADPPDVVLMDVRMPGTDGLEATRRIAALDGTDGVRVIILTTFDLDEYVYGALRAGASGFLLKDTPPADLLEAVRLVARGDALLAPSVTRRLIEEFARRPPPAVPDRPAPALAGVTEREREVLALVAQGASNKAIGATLSISERTARTHVSNILMKLGLGSRTQAALWAIREGLAPAPEAER